MENWEAFLKQFILLAGFKEYTLDFDAEHRKASLFIHEDQGLIQSNLPTIVESLNYLIQLVARAKGLEPIFVDVNNYRKERERLIVELARATARKALATKSEVALPAMNSYERRIAHMELAAHPDIQTESFGKGKGRYVVVRPIGAPVKNEESV